MSNIQSGNKLQVSTARLNVSEKNVKIRGIKYYNDLAEYVINPPREPVFKDRATKPPIWACFKMT